MGDGASFLLETLRARPAARRLLSGVSVLLAVFAVGLLAYPMYTNLYQGRLQSKLAIQFNKPETKQAYVAGQTAELESLLPDLVEFTLAPYVGNDEAARIARS